MTPDPDYPRMLFHPSQPPVTVASEAEEKALGPEWSRTIPAPLASAPGYPPAEESGEEEERKPVRPKRRR